MDIYFDESIHDRANFIVLAAVCATPDLIEEAEEALRNCGFEPGVDEFKSSMKMLGNAQAQQLRELFRAIIGRSKIAVGVCSRSERPHLMAIMAKIIAVIAAKRPGQDATVHLDEGIKSQLVALPAGYLLRSNCDSRRVIGIQLADCCAHFISTMLLGEMGLFDKMVPANRVYPGNEGELELAWELWASIRYALAGSKPVGLIEEDGYYEPLLEPFGLVITEGCDPSVGEAARNRLGEVWVGCIQ